MPTYTQSVLTPDPLYLQTKSYDARSDRKPYQDIISPGIVNPSDFAVTVTTGMGISIAPGVAWVAGQNVTEQGYYRQYIAASVPLTVGAANGSNPRLDQVILRVMDNTIDSSGSNEARIEIVPGTPVSGATLANRNGAASLLTLGEASKSVLLLADVLVPQAAGSLNSGNIGDKRVLALPKNTSLTGTLALRPAANAVPAGMTYFASDDVGGTLYRSNGTTWIKLSHSISNIGAYMRWSHTYVGGPDANFRFPSGGSILADVHSGTSWITDPNGLGFRFPLTGIYLVSFGSEGQNATGGTMGIFLLKNGNYAENGARASIGGGGDPSGNIVLSGISHAATLINVTSTGDNYNLGGYYSGGSVLNSWATAIYMPLGG